MTGITRYALLAAINAVHTDGPATDWTQVLALYDQLLLHSPTPVVALNRAVAVAAHHRGPAPLPWLDPHRCMFFYEGRVFAADRFDDRLRRVELRVIYQHI